MPMTKTAAALCGSAFALLLGGCSIPFDTPLGGGSGRSDDRAPATYGAPADAEPAPADAEPRTRFQGDWVDETGEPASRRVTEACYDSAAAVVARDERIDADIDTREETATWGAGDSLVNSMRSYGNETRLIELYADCLRSRGYQRR